VPELINIDVHRRPSDVCGIEPDGDHPVGAGGPTSRQHSFQRGTPTIGSRTRIVDDTAAARTAARLRVVPVEHLLPGGGVDEFKAALSDAERHGSSRLDHDGVTQEFRIEPGAADIELNPTHIAKVDLSDDQLGRLLSCMGYRLEVERRAVVPDLTRKERRSWKLHRQLSTHLTRSTLTQWRPTILANLDRLREGVRGQPHIRTSTDGKYWCVTATWRRCTASSPGSTATLLRCPK
jgi:hypothetical protein